MGPLGPSLAILCSRMKSTKVHIETVTLGWGERNKTLQTFSILYQQDGETKFHVGKSSTSSFIPLKRQNIIRKVT